MPEGPEIRYIRELLNSKIVGKSIVKITAYSNKRVYAPKPNQKIIQVGCKGKLLWIRTISYYIHIHFGITGWLYYNRKPNYTKYIIKLSGNNTIYVDSMRKFTKMKTYTKSTHHRLINKLGIDILTKDFTLETFQELIKKYKTSVSKFLLDQNKLSGVGNYIRNEALYLAKIHPLENTSTLSNKQVRQLYDKIVYVAYSSFLSWLNGDFKVSKEIRSNMPNKLQIPYKFRVYDKETDSNGNRITFEKNMAGRRTFYVKKIQKLNK